MEDALALLEFYMGFMEPDRLFVPKDTLIGTLHILRSNLKHIVEKRLDARERYTLLALDTLENPYEIWETLYDDEQVRYLFIGTYRQKQQMLVVVAPWDGKVLWNFMHTDAKSLNKHRQGILLYKRH
ncbi:PBECR2 nuclease fold domain-containing protein [Erwinia sp. DT-104]|uniref:PBECR2 nuclease fold domain-containing protein n=1 Tax=Erwinia sp. DT-104 TaxID=3396161 RepID=UPI003F1C16B0